MLKKILIAIVGLIVLILLIGLALPSHLDVSSTETIEARPATVFGQVNELKNWPAWSYWNTLDPDMKVIYGEPTAGTGASYSWTSTTMGDGNLTITNSISDSLVEINLDFLDMGTASASYALTPTGNGTSITGQFSSNYGFNPVARWMGLLLMKSEIEKSFDYSLSKIKTIAESGAVYSIDISEVELSTTNYIGVSRTLDPRNMTAVNEAMGQMFSELTAALNRSKVDIDGPAFALFPSYSDSSMQVIAALPVEAGSALPAKYPMQSTQGGLMVKGVHIGPYMGLSDSYSQIDKYMSVNNLKAAGAPMEVYLTDPSVEPDTSKWVTEIYFPVSQ